MKILRLSLLVLLSLTLTLCDNLSASNDIPLTLQNSPSSNFDKGMLAARQHHYQTAVMEFKKAAQNGNIAADYNLGLLYDDGKGKLSMNPRKAIHYYRYAAKRGIPQAMLNLGSDYQDADNIPLAIKWYNHATYGSNANVLAIANYNLGRIYYEKPHYKNNKKAIQHFRDAASLHYVPALYYLGLMNFYGEGTPKNYQRAYNLFMLAKHYGVAGAQQGLNRIYFVLTIPQIKQLQKGKFNMSELIKQR